MLSHTDCVSDSVVRLAQRKTLNEMVVDAADSVTKIKDIDPYLGILQRAHAAGAGSVSCIHQIGRPLLISCFDNLL